MENWIWFSFALVASSWHYTNFSKWATFSTRTNSLYFIKIVNQSIWFEIICINGAVALHLPHAHIFKLWFSFRFGKSNWNCTSSLVQSREPIMQLLDCQRNVITKTEFTKIPNRKWVNKIKTGAISARRSTEHQSV